LHAFIDSVLSVKDTDWLDSLTDSFKMISLSVDEDEGIRIVVMTLYDALKVFPSMIVLMIA
jgi:hypothetical protein